MKPFNKKLTAAITAVFIAITALVLPASAASTSYKSYAYTDSEEVKTETALTTGESYIWGQWSSVSPISDFFDNNGIYTIAYCDKTYLYICRINDDLKVTKTLKIKKRLDLVGGVTCDGNGNYYVAYGHADTTKKGGTTTVDIAKYDHSGNHLGSYAYVPDVKDTGAWSEYTQYKGGWATREPFGAGNCSMVLNNGVLICHMGRGMYNGHQSCAIYAVNTSDMSRNTSYFTYTSHSFNQRAINASGKVFFCDHGDAYDRAFTLSTTNDDKINTFRFAGDIGENKTGAELGGICETGKGIVLVAASVKGNDINGKMQLFMQTVSKDLKRVVSSGSSHTVTQAGRSVTDTGVVWLTNYDDCSVRNVNIAGIGGDKVLIMFEKYKGGSFSETLYCIINADGNIVQKTISLGTARLNSTEELKYNGRNGCVYWTTASGSKKAEIHRLHVGKTVEAENIPDKAYTGKAQKPSVTVKIGGKTLKSGTEYTLSYKNNTEPGTATVIVKGKGKYSFTAFTAFTIKLKAPKLTVKKKGSSAVLSWTKTVCPDKRWYQKDNSGMWYGYTGTEPDTYEIWESENGGSFKLVKTVSGKSSSFTIKNLKSGRTYKFKIRACVDELKDSAEKKYNSPFSKTVKLKAIPHK